MTESAAWIEGYTSLVSTPNFTVNIGSVSIADYLVAELWCDRMTAVMRW